MKENIEVADWSREYRGFMQWFPSRSLIASIRDYQNARGPFQNLKRSCAFYRHRFWSVITGADIPISTVIGGGFLLPHPTGVVLSPDVVIGPNCMIFQQVTIASTERGTPILGTHVDVGAGAKILGAVVIGNNAIIGANSVVLNDVPPGAVAVGVPARVRLPLWC